MKDYPTSSVQQEEPDDISSLSQADSTFLTELRNKMLKFATLQLSDHHLAEDAVQEALVGAFKNAGSFARQAALKTWVFAILKNKITDILRKRKRNAEVNSVTTDDEDNDGLNNLFDSKGFWKKEERPDAWPQPMESVKNDHFWKVFETCLNVLPEKQAQLFMMREFIELDSSEICETLGITSGNLHIILYRARLRLRDCLQNNWFIDGEKS